MDRLKYLPLQKPFFPRKSTLKKSDQGLHITELQKLPLLRPKTWTLEKPFIIITAPLLKSWNAV